MTHRLFSLATALIVTAGLLALPLVYHAEPAHADALSTPDLLVDAGGDGQVYTSGTGDGSSQAQCTDGLANGNCTLREAIRVANADPALDVVGFSAAFQIQPNSQLPLLDDEGITIEGLVVDGVPVVHLDGSGLSGGEHGLRIYRHDQTVRNLVVYGFPGAGVKVNAARRDAVIEGNWIGLTPDPNVSVTGNGAEGVLVTGGHARVVGNTVSGNGTIGVHIAPGGGSAVVQGNTIGLDVDGARLPNGSSGVVVVALDVLVGTDGDGAGDGAERNVISGNDGYGVEVQQESAVVSGNYIGLGADGDTVRKNALGGVLIAATGALIGTNGDGSGDAAERNVISGNGAHGVEVQQEDAVIAGNTIGLNAAGDAARLNTQSGVYIDASGALVGTDGSDDEYNAAERNVISGNRQDGVHVRSGGTGAVIAGNYIGTDAEGTTALGNGGSGVASGVLISASGVLVGTDGDGVADAAERNVISSHRDSEVKVVGADAVIAGNHIGTDAIGVADLSRGQYGVYLAASGALVGTDGDGTADAAERNVISSNYTGVHVLGADAVIAGNYIGTDVAGAAALGVNNYGISIFASGALVGTDGDGVGDAAERNVISGDRDYGVYVGTSGTGAVIAGNHIGIDAAGSAVLGRGNRGVSIFASGVLVGTDGDGVADAAERNVISGSASDGVAVGAGGTGAVIAGNYIGTDATGLVALGNGSVGVSIFASSGRVGTDGDGVADAAERNVISGNATGVLVGTGGTSAVIAGNYIGTDATGSAVFGRPNGGISIAASGALVGTDGDGVADAAERNVISGSKHDGVYVAPGGTGAVIAGNYIGTDAAGTTALGNDNSGVFIYASGARVGTDGDGMGDAAERNVISGSGHNGVYVGGTGAVIAGNYIGTDAAGTTALENRYSGVYITASGARVGTNGDGTADAAERNVISGNRFDGVTVVSGGTGAVIAGNTIGADAAGLVALGNGYDGVQVGGGRKAVILGNAIYGNGDLGIDRATGGVTPGGAPVIDGIALTGPAPGVSFTLASTADRMHRVEVFASPAPDPSGYGEGARFLGAAEVTTDASGDATGFVSTADVAPGEYVTATATRATPDRVYDQTSEFSRAVLVNTVTITGGEGWRMLAVPSTSETVGGGVGADASGLLGPLWTQGYPGSDHLDTGSNVFFYGEATPGGRSAGYTPPTSADEIIGPGRGALVYVYQDDDHNTTTDPGQFPKTLTVTGPEPIAPFAFAPTFTASDSAHADGWNLFGNPFAAGLDWDAGGWTKYRMSNAVYVWDPASGEYLTWNGTAGSLGSGVIAPYQAFWAQATGAPTLIAPEASRIGGGAFHGLRAERTSATAKTASAAPIVGLRVTGTVGGHERSTSAWATFSDGASLGPDPFDAYELASLAPEAVHLFWRASGGEGLDIAALPVPTQPVRLHLDVSVTAPSGPLTLTWPTLPDGWKGVLVDRETQAKVNLIRESSYTFEVAPASGAAVPGAAVKGARGVGARGARMERASGVGLPVGPRVIGAPTAGAEAKTAGPSSRFLLVLRPPNLAKTADLDALSLADLDALDADEIGVISRTVATAPEAAAPEASAPGTVALASAPEALALAAPAPNPSRGAVALGYDVPLAGEVSLVVIDALGREVVSVARGPHAAGRYSARLDAGGLAPGVYVVRLQAGREARTARFTVVR